MLKVQQDWVLDHRKPTAQIHLDFLIFQIWRKMEDRKKREKYPSKTTTLMKLRTLMAKNIKEAIPLMIYHLYRSINKMYQECQCSIPKMK